MERPARGTSTSAFGAGKRESHDASAFYARFTAPVTSDDEEVHGPFEPAEPLACLDSRRMPLPDNSVALVVTSPPYFAGKEYEAALGEGHIPGTYLEYLGMLRDVFAECRRVLEPGGRIAVNVANLGRKPYRSLAADVIAILQDELGLLLRGEVIWQKAEGASGSCAWGSFRSAVNPVLRDLTERVVIASKGRFDRARTLRQREAAGLPHRNTLTNDEFMEATLDVWNIAPESARRVGHPAPFPVELPARLIELYTFAGDLVLDPFLGAGSTAVAAVRTGRRYAGYDTDESYVAIARDRVAAAAREAEDKLRARAADEGKSAQAIAEAAVADAGFEIVRTQQKVRGAGLAVPLVARDQGGSEWYFEISGSFTATRGGLARSDVLWRTLGRVGVMAARGLRPVVLVTSHLPRAGTDGDRALRAAGPDAGPFFDAVEMLSDEGRARLAHYARGGHTERPLPGFWTPAQAAGELWSP
jgi:site-specific DNA-methyltransferase (adenine-specific)